MCVWGGGGRGRGEGLNSHVLELPDHIVVIMLGKHCFIFDLGFYSFEMTCLSSVHCPVVLYMYIPVILCSVGGCA